MSKKRLPLVLLTALVVLLFAGSASAAWFLKLEGVEGESKDTRHPGWIELQTYSVGSLGPNEFENGGTSAARLRAFNTLHATKKVDKSSPLLLQAKGKPTTGYLDVCRPGAPSCVRYLLHTVQIHDIKHAGPGSVTEYEEIALVFQKIEVSYTQSKTAATDDWQQDPGSKGPSPTPTHVPTPSRLADAAASGAVAVLDVTGRITGVSAVPPVIGGLRAAVTVASTGPCKMALVDFGDGSISLSIFNLAGTSTPLPEHTYATPGQKKIRVGGQGDPGWGGPPKKAPNQRGSCSGYAETTVTLRNPVNVQAVPH